MPERKTADTFVFSYHGGQVEVFYEATPNKVSVDPEAYLHHKEGSTPVKLEKVLGDTITLWELENRIHLDFYGNPETHE